MDCWQGLQEVSELLVLNRFLPAFYSATKLG